MKLVLCVLITTLLVTQLSSSVYETDAIPPPFPSYILAVGNLEFRIMYESQFGSAKISLIELDQESNSLLVTLDRKEQTDDALSLYLPRYLIESKVNGTDTRFNVLVNGASTLTKQQSNEMEHYLAIPLKPDTSTVKIIGTETLSITFDTTTLSIKDCCFWASTDKTVYFPGEEMIVQGSVAKKLSIEATIYIFRNNELVSLFHIPEDKITDEGFFSYSFGPAIQTGEYNLRMTYGSISYKTNFSVLATGEFPEDYSIVMTPFTISFAKEDFDKFARIHPVLLLEPGSSANVHIRVHNNDVQATHEIKFYINFGDLSIAEKVTISFDRQSVTLAPNSFAEVLMHITAKSNLNETYYSSVGVAAYSTTFGAVGEPFHLLVGNNVAEYDTSGFDTAMRVALPGSITGSVNKEVSMDDIEGIFGYRIGFPSYLPYNYTLQDIDYNSDDVRLLYSPVEITAETGWYEFFRDGGMFVIYYHHTVFYDEAAGRSFNDLLRSWTAFGAQQVMVNDFVGIARDQENQVTSGFWFKEPSDVILYKDNFSIELRGNMPLQELLQVAASIQVPEVKKPPVIISKVELYGPAYFVEGVDICGWGKSSISDAFQWLEIRNIREESVKVLNDWSITVTNGTQLSFVDGFTLGPKESCLIQTADVISVRIGHGGSGGLGPPGGYNLSAVILKYSVETDRVIAAYKDSTPELSDTYGDTRNWQLIDGEWVFKNGKLPDADRTTLTEITEDGSVIVNLILAEEITAPTFSKFRVSFIDALTQQLIDNVSYQMIFEGTSMPVNTSSVPLALVSKDNPFKREWSIDGFAENGTDTQIYSITSPGSLNITIRILGINNEPLAKALDVKFATLAASGFREPLRITEVELDSDDGGQWIELYNPTDRPINATKLVLQQLAGGWATAFSQTPLDTGLGKQNFTMNSAVLQPDEYRVFEISSEDDSSEERFLTSRSVLSLVINEREVSRTPELTDNNADSRTWQLEGKQWVFAEATPSRAIPEFAINLMAIMVIGLIGALIVGRLKLRWMFLR